MSLDEIPLTTLHGDTTTFGAYADQVKLVVNVASRCGLAPQYGKLEQLQRTYGDRVEFIHQEVFVDNTVEKGLRPPLEAFNLRTEPWLFAVDAEGKVTERLEGSFGFNAMERAIKSAL